MKFRLFLSSFFVFFSVSVLSAQELPSWKILEEAEVCFEELKYGEALRLSNDALKARKSEIQDEFNTLEISITPAQVRRYGKEFDKVIEILTEREQKKAVSIINKYLDLYGEEYFNNDIYGMLAWLKAKETYPEANYLIGQIYQVEGELETAGYFFEKAYKDRKYLDVYETQYQILYDMAYLAKVQGDKEKLEKMLLLILDDDKNFKDKNFLQSITRTIKQNKSKNVDRLYLIYRAESKFSIKALYELSHIYEDAGMEELSVQCVALATVEAFTHFLGIMEERDSLFSYSNLTKFFIECAKYDDICIWAQENHVWELFYLLALKSKQMGCRSFSTQFLLVLSNSLPDEHFKTLSRMALTSQNKK